MIRTASHQSGFSAAELLITLFVAAIFLMAGYQLYGTIVNDSGETRRQARANIVAHETAQRYGAQVPATCTTSTPVNNVVISPAPEGLMNARLTVTYACALSPASALPGLTRVTVKVTYDGNTEGVTHAIFANHGS